MTDNPFPTRVIEIPEDEKIVFEKAIKNYRKKKIRGSEILVIDAFKNNPALLKDLDDKNASKVIIECRELVWQEFLKDEAIFNEVLMRDLADILETPKKIIDELIDEQVGTKNGEELRTSLLKICGAYAGRVYPYIYYLALSNTNSRRSRSGATFQDIIYAIYTHLNYSFDSQAKVGTKEFEKQGLGKIVDSILPGIKEYAEKRDKTIIGTMKTSLRERWQEVVEESERTKLPWIYLLTCDTTISENKAKQMAQQNLTTVVLKDVKNKVSLKGIKSIISFEEYFFQEIPERLSYWGK